jgi:hypothetical protein
MNFSEIAEDEMELADAAAGVLGHRNREMLDDG